MTVATEPLSSSFRQSVCSNGIKIFPLASPRIRTTVGGAQE